MTQIGENYLHTGPLTNQGTYLGAMMVKVSDLFVIIEQQHVVIAALYVGLEKRWDLVELRGRWSYI